MGFILFVWVALTIAAILTAILRSHPYVGPIIVIALFIPFGGAIALAWACWPLPKQPTAPKRHRRLYRPIANGNRYTDDFLDSMR